MRRKSSASTQGLAPLPEPGTGPRRASHAQPRRPARRCGAGLLPRGPLGGQALPTARSPTPRPSHLVPQPLQRGLSQPGPPPRPRIHLPTCPRAQRRSRATPLLPLSCATRAAVRGHPQHLCLPGVLSPAQTDPSRSALCGQQRCTPPHKRGLPGSWVHSSKCGWLRVPQTQAWARGWLWTPVTMQGQQRLFPTPTPDSNASNSATDEGATKPLLLSSDHPEVCKISPVSQANPLLPHLRGGPPQQLRPPWRHPEAGRPSPPSRPDALTALSPRPAGSLPARGQELPACRPRAPPGSLPTPALTRPRPLSPTDPACPASGHSLLGAGLGAGGRVVCWTAATSPRPPDGCSGDTGTPARPPACPVLSFSLLCPWTGPTRKQPLSPAQRQS